MEMSRSWAMPNKNTFSIKPINKIVDGLFQRAEGIVAVDPFVGDSPFADRCSWTNDLDPDKEASHHMDALDFLKLIPSDSADLVLFDPPYSPRQVSECYKKMDKTVNMQTTQSSFWGNLKKEVARICSDGAFVVTCGWNSGGMGKTLGFEIQEVHLIAHGGWHNDTIVTVEQL
mgnify:FL=1